MSYLEKSTENIPSMIRSLIFVALIALILYTFIYNINKHVNPNSVSISASDGISVTFGDSQTLSSLLIHPRGWQSTGIHVKEGDILNIDASGSIHIAMGRMVTSLTEQYKIKDKNNNDGKGRSLSSFTDEELNKSIFAYPWNSPTGIDIATITDNDAAARVKKLQEGRVSPKHKVGQLLAVIGNDSDITPDLTNSQIVGYTSSSNKIMMTKSGFLWFIVNDEKPKDNIIIDRIIWQDNLGMFIVKVLKQNS